MVNPTGENPQEEPSVAIRDVLRMGHPELLRKADPVMAFDTPELHALIMDMRETMAAKNGAGIAAPQIGVPLRVVIFGLTFSPRYPHAEPVPMTILINPTIEPLTTENESYWEGCLSVPGMRGWVPRVRAIKYSGYDASGHVFEREVEGFHARVVQHECDHLEGVLYPQRIEDMTKFGFIQQLFPPNFLPVVEE